MTDRFPPLPPQPVTPSQTTLLSPKSIPSLPSHGPNKLQAPVEEEPYTIKCICNFSDDDGNTIYCEECDSWQHIECYYPLNIDEALREDFAHSCVDCNSRLLDREGARERQELRHSKPNATEASDRKAKRPPSKANKKKAKPTDLTLNGYAASDMNTKHLHDHPPTHQHKKSKSTHRPSQSISSQNPKRSPSYSQKSGNPHGHPPSPATTPPDISHELEIHYSSAFLNLYKDDRDVSIVQTNSFASLLVSDVMSIWLRDHDKLRIETGCRFEDVFRSSPPDVDSVKTSPRVEAKKSVVGSDTVVHWQYLTTSEAIGEDVPLIELNGQIGIQKDYCNDPNNRWQELSSPLPFVFFHPRLPIYIDTRREGSLARYVRRSCKPNATLDTYLSDGSEYHFWLVSDRRIASSEQITIPWEFNLQKDVARRWEQLLGLGDEETSTQPEYNDKETETYQSIASWVHAVLSEYGGCACELGPDCAFARFHRTYITKPQQSKEKSSKKKSRKPKASAISPTSTGHATNSRAASEGHGDDGADNDSGSSRSKPPSRDMTPAPRQGSFDTLGVLTELTDRDKRKVQMVEDSFRRMEQQPPPRKKKRASDGTNNPGITTKSKPKSTTGPLTSLPNGTSERRYVDAGTSQDLFPGMSIMSNPRKQHDLMQPSDRSPLRHPSQGPHPQYRDTFMQTGPVGGGWHSGLGQKAKITKRVVPLSRRLVGARRRLREEEDRKRASLTISPTSVTAAMVKMDIDSPKAEQDSAEAMLTKDDKPTTPAADPSTDMPMGDASPISPKNTKSLSLSNPTTAVTASTTTNTSLAVKPKGITAATSTPKNKTPELRVQMPPVPTFNGSVISSVTTPLSTAGTLTQSPSSAVNVPSPFLPLSANGVQPSPIKKKLSLSDYTKSRMNKAAAVKPGVLKPPTVVEAKSPTSADTMMLDPPATDKNVDQTG
ncbi:hypothetical protein GGS23DRAFT_118347 [Durotheca rogersii]|uniref:uncharacterized protein n=1 Tax=Durotheca rogersii TaxID=419775 RepID=UPI00221F7D77|nr:uncharacterized protein GGS23DRAFT_118347 [Durotheca rogersii]KAI5861906.1 hypothetical protein GGS23DRAFT_118347 [Durotheca rogersii]